MCMMKWLDINWSLCYDEVKRLQAAIAVAYLKKDFERVNALQRILVNSLAARVISVRRVSEQNQGNNTPGVDGEVWNNNVQKMDAVHALKINPNDYQPQPVRRVYIPKANGGKRSLGIPVMFDRALQAVYQLALDPIAECGADKYSFAYWIGRST
jgi:RNA-directed DNA polymerase